MVLLVHARYAVVATCRAQTPSSKTLKEPLADINTVTPLMSVPSNLFKLQPSSLQLLFSKATEFTAHITKLIAVVHNNSDNTSRSAPAKTLAQQHTEGTTHDDVTLTS